MESFPIVQCSDDLSGQKPREAFQNICILKVFLVLFVLDSRIDVETKYLDFENWDVVILASLSPDTNSQIV